METENINELYKEASKLFEKGDYAEALKYYYRMLSYDLNNSISNYNVGVTCGVLGDIELAVAFYKRAIRLDEKNIRAINNLAAIYIYNIKDFDMAVQYLDYAIKLAPNDPEAYNAYGNIYLFKEDYKKAQMYIRKAVLLDEKYYKNHYDMARACFGLKQNAEAKKEAERCLELCPGFEPAVILKNSL